MRRSIPILCYHAVDASAGADRALRPPPAWATAWVVLVCALLGFTLDNTHPYQGDETYYIKSAIGMLQAGDLLVPRHEGEVRLQKPILAYWLTALGYTALGISLWGGRVPFLLVAAALLAMVYRLARMLGHDRDAASLSVVLLSSSLLFLLFSRVSMTDLPLALFSTAALYFLCRARSEPAGERRDLTLAYLSMGAGFLAKGPMALLPLTAVTIWVLLAKPADAGPWLRRMSAPRHLVAFLLVASPWYVYLFLAHPDELQSQFTREASENLGPGVVGPFRHLVYYLGALAAYHFPAAGLTAWAWWKNGTAAARASRVRPLAWYAGIGLAVPVLLFAHDRDRYLLPVLPVLSVIMAHVIREAGLMRRARLLAAVATVAQIAGIWAYSYLLGRPLHELAGYWDQHLRGELAVHAAGDREATWALAIAGGRLAPPGDRTPYILAPAEEAGRLPGYEVVRRAARASALVRDGGRLRVKDREYVLLGLRTRPAGPGERQDRPGRDSH
ncbi:MAG: glycosyltransferase family 39 protein [Vicinamibacterales bacterium]